MSARPEALVSYNLRVRNSCLYKPAPILFLFSCRYHGMRPAYTWKGSMLTPLPSEAMSTTVVTKGIWTSGIDGKQSVDQDKSINA